MSYGIANGSEEEDEYGDRYETPWSSTDADEAEARYRDDKWKREREYDRTGRHPSIPSDYHNDGGKEIGWGD